jgi:hypothetical protein
MKVGTGRVLDRLPAEEPCLGALFTSYSFDPAFFEEHVLRAVLRLTSDPVEQAERYHQEARRALQETPVVAIVDAAERRPGRRLPFDLLEVADTVFHPKSALLLYREFARLLIGSGNLTFSGYGGNTELFLCADLAYGQSADAALLEAFDDHLGRVCGILRRPGTQLKLFREELRRRIPQDVPADSAASLALLDSTKGPIIEQLANLLPENAVIDSVGMLAPFYERDDGTELDLRSVFGALAARAAKDAILDVGISWDNPQVHAFGGSELEDGLGHLWTWAYESDGARVLEHLVPTSIGPKTISYIDSEGNGRRWSLEEVREAIEERSLWMQPAPRAFAPRNAVTAAADRFSDVRMWLHPATKLLEGRPVHRPLHAKLLVVGYRAGRSRSTLVLMGSPNMSRRALLMAAGAGQGNVEVAVAVRLSTSASLREFVPDLTYAPASALDLQEREFPDLGRNYALAIDEAVHDPAARTLTVTWSAGAQTLPAWRLTYDGQTLATSEAPPGAPVTVGEFSLKPTTAEVVLHVEGQEYPAPILVTDLIALPAGPAGPSVGLDELLMLLGRRIGAERAVQIAQRRAAGTEDSDELSAFFGEGFGPTDVFRAWWSVAEDLQDSALSVQAFRLRLEGALGVGAAWRCMVDGLRDETAPVEEVWFYGAELLRALREVDLPAAEDRDAKCQLLSGFCDRIRTDLGEIGFVHGSRPWVMRILAFYDETEA